MEIENPVMFQESPDHRANADILGEARIPGRKRTDATHDEVDFDASLARLVKCSKRFAAPASEFIFAMMRALLAR
jgi:hypothetical protein